MRVALSVVVLLSLGLAAPTVATAPAEDPVWIGNTDASPREYRWLDYSRPSVNYAIAIVRGRTVAGVLRILGVRRELEPMTRYGAGEYGFTHMDEDTYAMPTVFHVERLGHAVVVYDPSGYRASQRIERLSRRGIVAEFSTTVEMDTIATVAKDGTQVRWVDPFMGYGDGDPLPEEEGLDLGGRAAMRNPWATGWALLERVTLTHLDRQWFSKGRHPTYQARGMS